MPDFTPVLTYINDYWPRIIRHHPEDEKTLIGLPHPYLVPSTVHELLIVDMAENMAYLFQRFGVIPNASRYYFLSRSQPPFFTQIIWLAYAVKQQRNDPDAQSFLARMMTLAAQEHETVWLGTAQPHHRQVHAGLSRYFDINYIHQFCA